MTMLMRLTLLTMRTNDHAGDDGYNDHGHDDEDADPMMTRGCYSGRCGRDYQQYPHVQLHCSRDFNFLGISGSTSARPPATRSAVTLRTWQTGPKQGFGFTGTSILGTGTDPSTTDYYPFP